MARSRRVKLDVRWDAGDVAAAEGAAAASGCKVAVVMRAAVKIGLKSPMLAGALRAESTAVGGGAGGARTTGGGREFLERTLEAGSVDQARLTSEVVRMMGGAAAAPPGGAPSASSSRPAPAARPQQIKLAVFVARRLDGGAYSSGPIPPTIGARAVRMVMAGRVLVGGEVCRDANRLVNPGEVSAAPSS